MEKYCEIIEYKWPTGNNVNYVSLKKDKSACIFLKDKMCCIHEDKPITCKLGPIMPPLFDGNLFDTWHRENCAGVETFVNSHNVRSIFAQNKEILEKEYSSYYNSYYNKDSNCHIIKYIKNTKPINSFLLKGENDD